MKPPPSVVATAISVVISVGWAGAWAAPPPARAAAAASPAKPPVYEMALPVAASLVAFLDVAGKPDLVDLDLRVEVVETQTCNDEIAGLARRGGPSLDGPDVFDVVVRRTPGVECRPIPTRIGRRWAVRIALPEGAARDVTLGQLTVKVARANGKVTLDGQDPTGDVPGAPPTAAPATLVTGDVEKATIKSATRLPHGVADTIVDVTAKWPKCAGAPVGMLGRGDLASHFQLTHFEPLAVAPLDGSCGSAAQSRRASVPVAVHIGEGKTPKPVDIDVGKTKLIVDVNKK